MVESSVLMGICGLYCGACHHYLAGLPEREHLLEPVIAAGRDPDQFTCAGCRSDVLYIHPGCSLCPIRDCATARGHLHCGQCPDLPCERLVAFRDDGHPPHLDILAQLASLSALGSRRWLAHQRRRWTCRCGLAFGWHEQQCARCGATLDSYSKSPRPLGCPARAGGPMRLPAQDEGDREEEKRDLPEAPRLT